MQLSSVKQKISEKMELTAGAFGRNWINSFQLTKPSLCAYLKK